MLSRKDDDLLVEATEQARRSDAGVTVTWAPLHV